MKSNKAVNLIKIWGYCSDCNNEILVGIVSEEEFDSLVFPMVECIHCQTLVPIEKDRKWKKEIDHFRDATKKVNIRRTNVYSTISADRN